ncbi:hypothetical protein AB0D59_29930 [Streptomyces sp. NPDC048417]|uniref:hypothetical protein n=1 Tax=Streptomyces sp. NPDC048417 TaxID=3155387 RepID=UPI0034178A2E
MSDAVRIARMRLHRPRHGTSDAYAAVRALDLAPPAPDRSVLVIRRLSVPAAQPRTVRDRVAALRGSAARPALGPTPSDCTAVVFSDEVEAMTCLTADLVAGRAADRWYWPAEVRREVRSAGTGTTLARIWLDRPAWVPATLARLVRSSTGLPEGAIRAISLLSDAQARAVIGAVLTAFHATQARTGPARGRIGASAEPVEAGAGAVSTGAGAGAGAGARAGTASAGVMTAADRLPAPAPDRPLALASYRPEAGAALRPAGRALLSLGLTLAATPWVARDGRLAGEIGDLLRPVDPAAPDPAGPYAYATPDRAGARATSPCARQRADVPADFGPTAADRPPSARSAAHAVRRPDPAGTRPTTGTARRPVETPADDRPDSYPAGAAGPPDATGTPTPARPAAGEVVETRFATLFYAVNLMTWLDLPRTDAHEPVSGWATLEALGAWLLPDASATGPRTGDREGRDPIWRILAELDGRDPHAPTPLRLDGITDRLRDLLDRHRLTPEVFARPGTLVIGRTHVDVVLGLHQIDLAARSSGLDQDPGWVPALGRIIAFHYEGFDHEGFDHGLDHGGLDHGGLDHGGLDHDGFAHDGFDGGN